ncbi:hypothetical protein C2G38_2171541 [Gigaspora rosea]|uniref:Uncharacterized protein n=1 Tax=Gigaspora rosea TaxID=44941 RepID=A0A397VLG1_9GLOM|nr:hypothetical protein C2G38_2171541 [Gigaspora rosea]
MGHIDRIFNDGRCYEKSAGMGMLIGRGKSEPTKHVVDLRVIRLYLLTLNAKEQSLLLPWVYLTDWDRDRSRRMKKAFKYYKKSTDLGNAYGTRRVGYCYEKGIEIGAKKNRRKHSDTIKSANIGDVHGTGGVNG